MANPKSEIRNPKYPSPATFVDVPPYRLRQVRAGAAGRPAVVVIHGAFGNLDDFTHRPPGQASVVEDLSADFDVIALDRPGSGHSRRPPRPGLSVWDYARLLHEWLAQWRVQRPIVVGHSLGGTIALAYAQLYPQELAALLVIAPIAGSPKDLPGIPFAIARRPVVGPLLLYTVFPLWARLFAVRTARVVYAPQAAPHPHVEETVGLATRPANFAAQLEDLATLPDAMPRLQAGYAHIAVPTTVMVGAADATCTPAHHARVLHAALPAGAEYVEVAGAGHALPVLCPGAVTAQVRRLASRAGLM